MTDSEFDAWHMARALDLARRGQGGVEPNPMVGCTIVAGDQIVGEGWHQRFGGPHAEIEALAIAGGGARGATLYATLEPCCHHGKTPPCTQAIIRAGVRRVVAAMLDPFPAVGGEGIEELRRAGIEVSVGLLEDEARRLNAPYLKLVGSGLPWVMAKWAMTLDGKIASHNGASRWISSESSRALVHQLRGRVDAIVVGINTALKDDPLLTARPPGLRRATRVVVDTHGRLPSHSQLVRTATELPLLVAVGEVAEVADRERLAASGCEVLVCAGEDHAARLHCLLAELGRRRMTNVLVEGGSELVGSLYDAGQVDEVHAFIAPRLCGGTAAPGPIGGRGASLPAQFAQLVDVEVQAVGGDLYVHGRVERHAT